VYAELSSLTHGILLNARESPPLKDRRVRQALNMAVDRQAIMSKKVKGFKIRPDDFIWARDAYVEA